MKAKELLKQLLPPVFMQGCRTLFRDESPRRPVAVSPQLSGDYASWQAAAAESTGYDVEIILKKTAAAVLKVKQGEAVFERDSVLFSEAQYEWPLLAGLMWVAARCSGRLNVLDFGGSLGSTYFQNRPFFGGLREVIWNIVEQAKHVEMGRRWFEDDQLKFYTGIEECLGKTQPKLILLSGVLQYLEYPYKTLGELLELPCDHIIVDRTPFWNGTTDRLCVQHVPTEIYPASFPSWIFSTRRFCSFLNEKCQIICEFDSLDKLSGPVDLSYRGMIVVRREPTS